jgi:hypothetical protein
LGEIVEYIEFFCRQVDLPTNTVQTGYLDLFPFEHTYSFLEKMDRIVTANTRSAYAPDEIDTWENRAPFQTNAARMAGTSLNVRPFKNQNAREADFKKSL